jgi:hypothetical protein
VPGPKYQVKLYGHTSDDVESFCKKLAAMLMVSETEAMIILHEVPLVIKSNLDKQAADNLSELLTSIRALSMVEPVEGGLVEEKPQVPHVSTTSDPREVETAADHGPSRSNIWMGLGLGAAACLVLFVIVGLISSYTNLYKKKPVEGLSSEKEAVVESSAESHVDEQTIAELETEVTYLEEEFKNAKMERQAAHKDFGVADYRLRVAGEMELRRKRIRIAEQEFKRVLNELVGARVELRRMKEIQAKQSSK